MKTLNIKIIEAIQIMDAVAQLCVEANTHLNPDIYSSICKAKNKETGQLAKSVLNTIIENADIAKREKLPICQDTGMVIVFVKIGANVHINGNINNAINEGVRRGYKDGYFRNSLVCDPINRLNTGDNTPAVIHYDFTDGEDLQITVMPKGFGSENMGRVHMFEPSAGLGDIEDFIIETVATASSNPCPPVIVGVGIGGTMDKAAILAKQALVRDIGGVNNDPFWAEAEARLYTKINELNIGPGGFGGKTTALGVHILTYPTHIAGLPLAVNIGCHATRHKTIMI